MNQPSMVRSKTPKGKRFADEEAAAARARGEKRYVSRRPCPKGHVGERFVSNYGCVECLRAQCRKYHKSHRGAQLVRLREYAKQDPGGNRERSSAARYASSRIPAWAGRAEIQAFYRECPPGHVVDHVVPLKGKFVSGLHVINNLQYITDAQNRIKGRRFNV